MKSTAAHARIPHAAVTSFQTTYPVVRQIARSLMRRERASHTLQPTALAHEAFLKLAASAPQTWRDGNHFVSLMVRYMRQILIDHARKRQAKRRAGPHLPAAQSAAGSAGEWLELDDLLRKLENVDSRAAHTLELFYFGGLAYEEIASALGVSTKTVQRDCTFARAWLQESLGKKTGLMRLS